MLIKWVLHWAARNPSPLRVRQPVSSDSSVGQLEAYLSPQAYRCVKFQGCLTVWHIRALVGKASSWQGHGTSCQFLRRN
jgi:hypothetical protein